MPASQALRGNSLWGPQEAAAEIKPTGLLEKLKWEAEVASGCHLLWGTGVGSTTLGAFYFLYVRLRAPPLQLGPQIPPTRLSCSSAAPTTGLLPWSVWLKALFMSHKADKPSKRRVGGERRKIKYITEQP